MEGFQVACGWGSPWLPLNFADEKSAHTFIKDFCCDSGHGHMVGFPARSAGGGATQTQGVPHGGGKNENHY